MVKKTSQKPFATKRTPKMSLPPKNDSFAARELYNIDCEKVNTLITPWGLEKSYVQLSKDYDVLDVANRVGVI
jgi:hypothetical protein